MSDHDADSRKSRPGIPPAQPAKRRIGELLLDEGLVTAGQLDEALALQKKKGGRVVENLIRLGYLDTQTFVDFLAKQPNTPSFSLTSYSVPRDLIDLVPREFAVKNEVFPIDQMGRLLTVGMACPLDSATISELAELTGLRVKALLCRPGDIRDAIMQYYPAKPAGGHEQAEPEAVEWTPEGMRDGLNTAMRVESIASLVRDLEALPALPDTVSQVRQAMEDAEVSMESVGDAISRDPAISAGVLRLANSAAYGFAHRVDSIHMAVKLLGLREICVLVTSAAVIDLFKSSRFFDYSGFWRRSLAAGKAVQAIARARGMAKPSGAFTAGLLADLGQLALAEVAPEQYALVSPQLEGLALAEEEERVLGLSHTETGYELASKWGLPEELLDAIRFHHRLDLASEHKELAAAVAVGITMARAYVDDRLTDPLVLDSCADALVILGLDTEQSNAILRGLAEDSDQS